jgi:hypothetical protein
MKAMVEVFKTNITCNETAEQILCALQIRFPFSKINFDLEDCDKILRVEDHQVCVRTVIELFNQRGFECEEL